MAELIAFNKTEKLEYEGFCKLTINACSNLLLIEPKNEDYKMISSLFTWKYIAEKANIGTKELIHKRFLPKLFEIISIITDPKLKKILANWINKCENEEKEKYIQLLKNYQIYDLFFPKQRSNNRIVKVESDIEEIPVNLDTLSENNLDGENFNEENNRRTLRKRSAPINYNNESDAEKIDESTDNNEYDETNAERPKSKKSKSIQTFNSPLKKIINESKFKREKYSKKIVELSNFKFGKFISHGKTKTKLLIFPNENDKTKCYEYFWNSRNELYGCSGCRSKNAHISARHVKTSKKEYIELLSNEHICKIRKYIPEKYNFDPIKQIIKSPNFEVFNYQHRGKSRKTVVVFLNEDKKMCHEYYFCKQSNGYFCNGCSQIGQSTKAVLQKNGNGKECFKINKAEHKCHPRKYNPEKFSGEIIVKKPMYKIIEEKVMGKSQTKLKENCKIAKL
uniref:Uncharacterized protein n=1 Tax=Panagrolaimus davidi TaxID=227884 RepID=A0A914QNL0_9BILA